MRRVSTYFVCVAASALFQLATAPSVFASPILASQLPAFGVATDTGATAGKARQRTSRQPVASRQRLAAMTNLGLLGPGTLYVDLAGLALGPGVHAVPAAVSHLMRTLALAHRGNANTPGGGTVATALPPAAVPEPGTLLLMGLGVAALVARKRSAKGRQRQPALEA